MISVVLLGAGRVATHLFNGFVSSENIDVIQWYNRTLSAIKPFQTKTEITDSITNLKLADVYIIAVSDNAIAKLASQLPFENRLVVHTSGSVGIHDLDKKLNRGVFYPLQTFSKTQEVDFKTIPICIEALDKTDFKLLKTLGKALSHTVYKINTEQRQTLHLAAVYVNNFVNQLYRIAHEISDAKNINFDILKPLILETAQKVQTMSPYQAQTGPALRGDTSTIKRHLNQLDNTQHKAIYKLLTQSIQDTHEHKL